MLGHLLLEVELNPLTAVRVDGAAEDGLDVTARLENDTRRTNELGDHDTLGAVHDERALFGHHREIAHEDGLLFDFTGFGVHEARPDEHGSVVGHVLLAALFDRELWRWTKVLVVRVEFELKRQLARVVLNWGDIFERFFEALVEEPLERVALNGDQVRKLECLADVGERVTVDV